MRGVYKKPVVKASADVKVPEPRIAKFVVLLLKRLGRLYLFLFFGVAKMVLQGESFVFDAFKRALAGKSRCIIAFRHPNGGEPQLLTWFFLFKLKGLAAKRKIRFARGPHAVFVYGYEVVRWGGWAARYIMPNVGAMPIHHTKMDGKGLARIYNAITDGPYPVAMAPEGQVSYTSDSIPRLEPALVRMGFNAAERLAARGDAGDCPVEVLPLSIHFRFGSWGTFTLEFLLRKVEKACGFPRRGRRKMAFTERVRQCRDHILAVNEARYSLPAAAELPFEQRLDRVVNAALETAERMAGILPQPRAADEKGFFARMYAMRQLHWDRIFLPGVQSLRAFTPVKKGVLDLQAGEAWYMGRHLELADFCWFFRVPLPAQDAALHKKIEYAQNLWDFANRTMGGAFKNRVNILPRKVIIKAAGPINISERLGAYRQDKKAAISGALGDLEKAFLACIDEADKNEKG